LVWRGQYGDSLTGDLIEQYQQGRSPGWFWRQATVALLIAPLRSTVRKWLAVFGLVALGVGTLAVARTERQDQPHSARCPSMQMPCAPRSLP
jgi:hypothetical protein